MEIYFSRHAKRRRKLYGFSEKTIKGIIKSKELSQGKHEIIETIIGYKYAIKIVVSVESNMVTVITNYPLKKGEWKK